MRRILNLSFQ